MASGRRTDYVDTYSDDPIEFTGGPSISNLPWNLLFSSNSQTLGPYPPIPPHLKGPATPPGPAITSGGPVSGGDEKLRSIYRN